MCTWKEDYSRRQGRKACAVESASLHHPDRQVIVHITAPSVDLSQPLLKILFGLPNVNFSWLDLDQLFADSAVQNWHKERRWLVNEERASIFISDAARWVLLQKYGGIYLDMDALSLRTLPKISDYIGRLDEQQINGAVVALTKNHLLSQNIVNAIPKVFDPYQCCTIGPELVTSVLDKLCPGNVSVTRTSPKKTLNHSNTWSAVHPDEKSHSQQSEICSGITIFPSKIFYPFSFELEGFQRFLMFKSGRGYWEKFLKTSQAYNLHLYNSLTRKEKVGVGGNSVLEETMKRHCPEVYGFLSRNENFI
ncbi:lactosylceramide 4-alpha-galactosyltransferase isoform X3 [Palaemon carinicauda]|uniref:lactosylceramide 4-alpha-galactosyltransferase isoform X3 n=1 Tax=Palaemon carinicauda TaxID=392227 RepID=UPI0035B5CB3C